MLKSDNRRFTARPLNKQWLLRKTAKRIHKNKGTTDHEIRQL